MICPSCGHAWTTTKAKRQAETAPFLAELTRTELYAHYKKTAPVQDVRFFLKNGHFSPWLLRQVQDLERQVESMPRTDVYRRLTALQDEWRRENYWKTVEVPLLRIERRLKASYKRMPPRIVMSYLEAHI